MMVPRKKDPETRLTAYKSNRIIYIGDAKKVTQWDDLTPNQLKIAMYSAAQVRPDDTQQTRYQLSFKEFATLAGLDEDSTGGKDYKRIFTEARKLSKLGVDFIAADGTLIGFNWLLGVHVSPKSGTVTYSIEDDLLPFYKTRSGAFALIELGDYMRLRGKYALLLYEFLAKWRNKGQVYQSIPALRQQLQVPDKLYRRTVDFMRRVVDGAVEEINDKAEISFKVEITEKRGLRNAVEGILFTIKPIITVAGIQAELLELMTGVEVPEPVALAILNDPERPVTRDYIVKNIKAAAEYLTILAARKEQPKSKKAIYMAALQNDWAGAGEGSPVPLFDAADVTPPGLCPICAGMGIITGPDGKATNCSCVAIPPDPNAPEDHETKWKGPGVDALREAFTETIGNGPAAAQQAPEPEPEMDPEVAARHERALSFTAEARRRMRGQEVAEKK